MACRLHGSLPIPQAIRVAVRRYLQLPDAVLWHPKQAPKRRRTIKASTSDFLYRRGKSISSQPDRLQERWLARIRLDLLTEAADMHVDTALDRSRQSGMGKQEQFLAGDDPARVSTESQQKIEFRCCQSDASVAGVVKPAPHWVNHPSVEAQLPLRRATGKPVRGATQETANPSNHFSWAEGLCNIVVGADFQSYDPVDFLSECRQQDYRDRSFRTDAFADAQAILARQHDIENNQVIGIAAKQGLHHVSVLSHGRQHPAFLNCRGQKIADFEVVFHDQYLRGC